MINEDTKSMDLNADPIYIHAPTETLVCSMCGKEYFSRGKHDIGICRDCEKYRYNPKFKGVPLGE